MPPRFPIASSSDNYAGLPKGHHALVKSILDPDVAFWEAGPVSDSGRIAAEGVLGASNASLAQAANELDSHVSNRASHAYL